MRFLRHVTAWLLASSLAACSSGGVSVPINKDAFTQAFVTRVHKRFPDAETNVRDAGSDDISVDLKWPDGAGFTWYPDNGYQQYRLDPAQLDAIMQRHLDSLSGLRAKKDDKSTPISSTQILPVVKTRDWLDGVEKLTRKNTKDEKALQDNLPLYRPLAGELVVTYVENRDNAMHFVGRAGLVRTGATDVNGLDALARGNFEKRLDSMRVVDEGDHYRLELIQTTRRVSPFHRSPPRQGRHRWRPHHRHSRARHSDDLRKQGSQRHRVHAPSGTPDRTRLSLRPV
jgi:hypothetical protein